MPKTQSPTSRFSANPAMNRHFFCWQGFSVRIPRDWNAIKLEGNGRQGFALLADLECARLGIRWATAAKNADPQSTVLQALCGEVGNLAANEAVDFVMPQSANWSASKLYVDPDPPGRDVWIGYSPLTGRLVQVTYHARKRERVLQEVILPALAEAEPESPSEWAVLDLSCVIPSGYVLAAQQLSAGDLRLVFTHGQVGSDRIVVRQIGPAELALERLPLTKWLDQHPIGRTQMYRPVNATVDATSDGRLQRQLSRRPRFFLHRKLPTSMCVVASHDELADRIVLIEAPNETIALETLSEVGWARPGSGRHVS